MEPTSTPPQDLYPTEKTADGTFPTSIVPLKAKLEPVRPTASELSTISVEVIHVFVFFLIIAFIFLSMWKDSKHVKN
jgi:hypothetical protein